MKKILLTLALILSSIYGETQFAEPKPAMDNPRQLIFSIPTADTKEVNRIISTVNNVIKFYGVENTEVLIVAYGKGLKALLKKYDADTRKRIEALITYDVEFIACENTMRTLHIEKKDLLDDIGFVTAGIVEIIERKLQGFTYTQP